MGLEARCTVRIARDSFAVKAHLNTDRVELRGGMRLDLPFATIKTIDVDPEGALVLSHAGGRATLAFDTRSTAEKWAAKIRSPKSLVDKLGVKPDSRVAVLGVADVDFLAQLSGRLGRAPQTKPAAELDFVFYAADSAGELGKLKTLRKSLRPAGAIWVVSLKGTAAKIKDTDVMRAARAAGLVDNKVCGFSATHTALKLVIPKARRAES